MRARRDQDRFLSLIEAVTLLYQYQRPLKTDSRGKTYIESTIKDYEIAYNLASVALLDTFNDLSGSIKGFYSTLEKEMWGLDMLLLDDPTQSFDVTRVELLLDELRNAANHAQLVIATPEEDRFDPFFSKYFPKEEINIVNVSGFEIENGPKLELE